MKIEILDYKVSKKRGKKECDLIIPFSITSNSGQIEYSAAEIDMKMMSFFVGRIPVVATSFLYFSAIIYAVDRSVSRDRHSIDGWSRELDVVIKIPYHEAFDVQKEHIAKLLSYLTGDYWTVSFQEASVKHH